MPQYIIHHKGAYNIYSTVVDAPYYQPALSKDQLEEITKEEYGNSGLSELSARLERAHKKGTSSMISTSLEDEVSNNRANKDGSNVPYEEFIERFLTLGGEPEDY